MNPRSTGRFYALHSTCDPRVELHRGRPVKCSDRVSGCQWAILSEGLLGNKLALIQEYNGCDGDCRVTSGYRCPHNNAGAGGATNSRHMYGDAFDVTPRLENWSPPTESKYNQLRNAALQTNPSFITQWNTYSDRHLHVDWR